MKGTGRRGKRSKGRLPPLKFKPGYTPLICMYCLSVHVHIDGQSLFAATAEFSFLSRDRLNYADWRMTGNSWLFTRPRLTWQHEHSPRAMCFNRLRVLQRTLPSNRNCIAVSSLLHAVHCTNGAFNYCHIRSMSSLIRCKGKIVFETSFWGSGQSLQQQQQQ